MVAAARRKRTTGRAVQDAIRIPAGSLPGL
jgi:hypothetical protein